MGGSNNTSANNTSSNNTSANNTTVCSNACFTRCAFDQFTGEALFIECQRDPATGCFDLEVPASCGPGASCSEELGCTFDECLDPCSPNELGSSRCVEYIPGQGAIEVCAQETPASCSEWTFSEDCTFGCEVNPNSPALCAERLVCPEESCFPGELRCSPDGMAIEECFQDGDACPEFRSIEDCFGKQRCIDNPGELFCDCPGRSPCFFGEVECVRGNADEPARLQVCDVDNDGCSYFNEDVGGHPCAGDGSVGPNLRYYECSADGSTRIACPRAALKMCVQPPNDRCKAGESCVVGADGVARCDGF